MHRECIPFPGPPEENELAVPNRTRKILKSYMFYDFHSADGNAIAN